MHPGIRYRSLRLCSGGGGFEAVPEQTVSLDLGHVRRALEIAGVPVVDARVLLIARLGPEVTLSRSGRVLIKTRDAAEANRTFDRFREVALSPSAAVGPARFHTA